MSILKLPASLAILLLLSACGNSPSQQNVPEQQGASANLPDGKAVFQANCTTCHNLAKDAVGPALRDVVSRWNNDTAKLKRFIRRPSGFYGTDPYVDALHKKYGTMMPPFPDLPEADLDALIGYLEAPAN